MPKFRSRFKTGTLPPDASRASNATIFRGFSTPVNRPDSFSWRDRATPIKNQGEATYQTFRSLFFSAHAKQRVLVEANRHSKKNFRSMWQLLGVRRRCYSRAGAQDSGRVGGDSVGAGVANLSSSRENGLIQELLDCTENAGCERGGWPEHAFQ